jgi:hypothetical protein
VSQWEENQVTWQKKQLKWDYVRFWDAQDRYYNPVQHCDPEQECKLRGRLNLYQPISNNILQMSDGRNIHVQLRMYLNQILEAKLDNFIEATTMFFDHSLKNHEALILNFEVSLGPCDGIIRIRRRNKKSNSDPMISTYDLVKIISDGLIAGRYVGPYEIDASQTRIAIKTPLLRSNRYVSINSDTINYTFY